VSFRLAGIRRIRWLQVALLAIAYFGVRLAERSWATEALQNPSSVLGIGVASVSLFGAALVEVWSRKKVPQKARALLAKSRARWQRTFYIHYTGAGLILGMGFLVELLFVSVSPLHILIAFGYLVATFALYYPVRQRIVSEPWMVLLAFIVSASSLPFSLLAYRNPALLAESFSSFGVSVQVSKDFSADFVIGLQFALVLFSALSLSHAWKSNLLSRNGLGVKDLQDRFELVLKVHASQSWITDFSEVFSDIPRLLSLFQEGNFHTAVALGWGMVDRALAVVSSKRTISERARDIGIAKDEFDPCRAARNAMAHRGQEPGYQDALRLLLLVRHMLELLSGERKSSSA